MSSLFFIVYFVIQKNRIIGSYLGRLLYLAGIFKKCTFMCFLMSYTGCFILRTFEGFKIVFVLIESVVCLLYLSTYIQLILVLCDGF